MRMTQDVRRNIRHRVLLLLLNSEVGTKWKSMGMVRHVSVRQDARMWLISA